VQDELSLCGVLPEPVTLVHEPAHGAVRRAFEALDVARQTS
jgi:hypothetical protein